jgi:hypothetical protein
VHCDVSWVATLMRLARFDAIDFDLLHFIMVGSTYAPFELVNNAWRIISGSKLEIMNKMYH